MSSLLESSFFMNGSVLPLKYDEEGKRETTEVFQFIYLSGNFPEKWHPVHRFISLHSLQWYRVPTIQPPQPSHQTLKNKDFYLSFTNIDVQQILSHYSINCRLRISWALVRILMPFFDRVWFVVGFLPCSKRFSLSSKTNMFRLNSIKNIPDRYPLNRQMFWVIYLLFIYIFVRFSTITTALEGLKKDIDFLSRDYSEKIVWKRRILLYTSLSACKDVNKVFDLFRDCSPVI